MLATDIEKRYRDFMYIIKTKFLNIFFLRRVRSNFTLLLYNNGKNQHFACSLFKETQTFPKVFQKYNNYLSHAKGNLCYCDE